MKYCFGSRGWTAAAHGILTQRASWMASQGIGDAISLCEIYRDMPPELGWDGNQMAWSCVCEAGGADFRLSERDDVGFKVAGTYAAFLELATYVIGGDPARKKEYAKLALAKVQAGEIEILSGNGLYEPDGLEPLHDVLARLTCA